MRYKVFEIGFDGKQLGVVEADTLIAATSLAEKKFRYARDAMRLEESRRKVKVKCGRCGWEFLTPERHHLTGANAAAIESMREPLIRCVLCQQDRDVEHKANIFLDAKAKLDEMKKARATKLGIAVEDLEKRLKAADKRRN